MQKSDEASKLAVLIPAGANAVLQLIYQFQHHVCLNHDQSAVLAVCC